MYKIAIGGPLGNREFTTRSEAVQTCLAYGKGPWRVYLNLRHPWREVWRVPSAG